MSPEVKEGQLLYPLGWEMYEKLGTRVKHSKRFEKLVKEK